MIKDLIIYNPMYVTFFWAIVLLLTRKENNPAKFFLGIFMSVAFLVYLSHAVFFQQDLSTYQVFDPIYVFSSLAVYPLYYWYIKLLTVETFYKRINLWYLLPAAVFSIATLVVYQFMSDEEKTIYIREFLLERSGFTPESTSIKIQKLIFYSSRAVFVVQVVLFLLFGRKLVMRYNQRVANFYSNLESKTIIWVKYLLYSFVATSIMSIVAILIGRHFFTESLVLLLIPSLIFSTLLFIIGLLGYMQNHTVVDLVKDEGTHPQVDQKKINAVHLQNKLLELFEKEKAYRKPELKITEVSQLLGTNRSYVSVLINNEFSCSFNEFVNKYRIEEAKRMMQEVATDNFSLNYIAESVGFGSIGTFIRVFKDMEGTTPGRYREANNNSKK
ncbi:MAG: AraC family transcriptional regulator [Mariniphaga sp.]|nr:AraC family transcriptional regulator [Mariniphaga sp.]